ncbi:MAG: hypothetical protein WBX22_29980, partial [Silvibacterium sp.]
RVGCWSAAAMHRLEEWPSSTEFGLQAACNVAPVLPQGSRGHPATLLRQSDWLRPMVIPRFAARYAGITNSF